MDTTPQLALPLIAAGQAQKHVTVNEALGAIDYLTHLAAESRTVATPPALPAEGARFIVPPAGATGAFAGHGNAFAVFRDAAWTFHTPRDGWCCWVADEARFVVSRGGVWLADMPPSLGDLATLGVNTTATEVERLRIVSGSSLFDAEGGSHRLKINRAATSDTASIVFQTGYAGRAEIGLTGGTACQWKVSANGTAWTTALTVETTTGRLTFGASPTLPGSLTIDGPQGTSRETQFRTGASLRWSVGANGQPETGGNDGSHFGVSRFNDAGTYLDTPLLIYRSTGAMSLSAPLYLPQAATTAAGANVVMDAANFNLIKRSTSSRQYKREITPLEDAAADRVLALEPVRYRSAVAGDRSDWSYYGLIAEDVATVDPRFVHWSVATDRSRSPDISTGHAQPGTMAHAPDAAARPDAVQYDRLVVPLISVVKRQQARLAALEQRLAHLEARSGP